MTQGDYCAVLGWVPREDRYEAPLQEIRHAIRAAKRAATTLGFGPRYLHSTGQEHKGGPASGVFLQVIGQDAADVNVPGSPCSFGIIRTAQARGDFDVLAARGRRVLRVDTGRDVSAGLARLALAVKRALG
jgi:transaldolase/glucose-6-phosphate isomerase